MFNIYIYQKSQYLIQQSIPFHLSFKHRNVILHAAGTRFLFHTANPCSAFKHLYQMIYITFWFDFTKLI